MSLPHLLRRRHHRRCYLRRGSRKFAYHFLQDSGDWFTCNCLGSLSLSIAWLFVVLRWPACGDRTQVHRCQDGWWSSSAARVFSVDMSMLSMCYSVRQSKTLFLHQEGLQLQAASSTRSSSNRWCGRDPSGGCFGRWRQKRLRPLLGLHCNFLFYRGCFCKSCNVNLIF